MAKKNIVKVDFTVLQSTITKMKRAKENLTPPVLTRMSSYSKLNVDEQINNALNKLSIAVSETYNLIDVSELSKLTAKLISWDQTKKKKKTSSKDKSSKTSKSSTTGGTSTKGSTKIEVIGDIKVTSKFKSLISPILPSLVINTNSVLKPTVNLRMQELQNLENYLKNGDLVSASKSYKFLKALGNEGDAQALLAKYGYKVEEKDGEYVISKIANEDISNNETTAPPNDNDVVAEVTPDTETIKQNTSNVEENNNVSEQVSNTKSTDNNQKSNNNNSANYSHSTNQKVVENTSTEVNGSDATTKIETDHTTGTDGTFKNNTNKENNKTNVVSITDDNESISSKKSGGLGAAVPIGLGTIATGAAAVAGVRYVKNRHENQEEYDEEYDDENNNLDNDGEYVDTAQYDSDSTYMDDDYLGPVDSNNISSDDEYLDTEDLEEVEDFSDDSVLNELNSNY